MKPNYTSTVGPGDKVQSIHAWTIDSSGIQYEVKDKEFLEVSPYQDALYTDIRYRAVEAPAGNPGSVIGWEYTVRRHIWMDQWHWFVQEDIPVDETRLTLQLPASWEYKASWANQAAQQPTQTGAESLAVDLSEPGGDSGRASAAQRTGVSWPSGASVL